MFDYVPAFRPYVYHVQIVLMRCLHFGFPDKIKLMVTVLNYPTLACEVHISRRSNAPILQLSHKDLMIQVFENQTSL